MYNPPAGQIRGKYVTGNSWCQVNHSWVSLARELSGGISLLVVRSSPGGRKWRGGTESDDARPRNGADDETTRCDFESDGKEADVDPGSRDRWDERAQHAAQATVLPRSRLRRVVRSAPGQAQYSSRADGDRRARAGSVPRQVSGFQRAALPREAEGN